jgi:hypothetical protein
MKFAKLGTKDSRKEAQTDAKAPFASGAHPFFRLFRSLNGAEK